MIDQIIDIGKKGYGNDDDVRDAILMFIQEESHQKEAEIVRALLSFRSKIMKTKNSEDMFDEFLISASLSPIY